MDFDFSTTHVETNGPMDAALVHTCKTFDFGG